MSPQTEMGQQRAIAALLPLFRWNSIVSSSDQDEFCEEAERLAALPPDDQEAVLDIYRECTGNPKLPRRDREWNRVRVEALERHLKRLKRKKRPKSE